jgi:hypothetical protein
LTARSTSALAILAAALLLAGCSHAGALKDPFVGTWQSNAPKIKLVIAKVATGYQVTGETDSEGPPSGFILNRHGSELTGTIGGSGYPVSVVVAYVSATGHLTVKSSAGAFAELSKASDSTASPGPQPARPVAVGPQWTKLLSFSGSTPGSAAMRWSAGFTVAGGTVRAVGTVTSDDPNQVGLGLALQRWQKTSARWVDMESGMAPRGQNNRQSRSTMAADWYTTHSLKAGEYRLGMMGGGGVDEKFVFTVYVSR